MSKTYCRLYYRIPFSETDAMKIVHHSNHARYLERGRVEFLRLVGLDYANLMARGMHFPLTEFKIEFKRPLVFDEIILVETEISYLSRVRLNFGYRIFSVNEMKPHSIHIDPFLDGKPSVVGETFHCCVNDNGRPVETAQDIYERLKMLQGEK